MIVPEGVIFPILPTPSLNQIFPSGPLVMSLRKAEAVGILYSVTVPLGVIFPILFALLSVNQILPSGPAVKKLAVEEILYPVKSSGAQKLLLEQLKLPAAQVLVVVVFKRIHISLLV